MLDRPLKVVARLPVCFSSFVWLQGFGLSLSTYTQDGEGTVRVYRGRRKRSGRILKRRVQW